MIRASIFTGLLAVGISIANAQENISDSIYGYSSVDYDSATNTIIGYVETDIDYSLEIYYEAVVTGVFRNVTSNQTLGTQTLVDTSDIGFIGLEFDFTAAPNTTYQVNGYHKAHMLVEQNYCDVTCGLQWVDYDYMEFYAPLGINADTMYAFLQQAPPAHSIPRDIQLGSTFSQAADTTPGPCGDARDTIIQEYVTNRVSLTPVCADFTSSAHTLHFTFNQLNTGDYTWAILRNYFLTNIETFWTQNGGVALAVNSGYRNPARQQRVDTANGNNYTRNSRHQFGDAIDFTSNAATFPGMRRVAVSAAVGGCAEPLAAQNNDPSHLHIDWRSQATPVVACPQGWNQ